MKELKEFTVERLQEMVSAISAEWHEYFEISHREIAALAKIALEAKQADTAYWITYYPNPDPNEFDDKEHSHSGAESCARRIAKEIGGYVVPVYHGAPPLNHTEPHMVVPDGWIKCSERMPEDEQEVLVQTRPGARYVSFYDEHTGLFFDMPGGNQMNCIEHILVTHWQPVAAPKPEM